MPALPRLAIPIAQFVEPQGRLKDNLSLLERQAEAGDNAAAYFLGTRLFECRITVAGDRLAVSDSEGLPGLSADCRGLSTEDVSGFKRWLQLAADRGDIDAQVSYSAVVGASITAADAIRDPAAVADYKRRAMDYLQRAVAQGSVAALARLSNYYANGIVAPQSWELAYAYQLAYLQASGLPSTALEAQYAGHLDEIEKARAYRLSQGLSSYAPHH